ncbi:hypothetical protein WN67_04125 [Mycolicibacterium obuense]|jgi:hypothetical protein|uniref:Antitoxin VbhA domain-containing protein n=2 Tax=Mycolicibacterium TaxID=1866885 RepID=A0A0M2K7U9_9MYCO|nr:hypothetical protein WN67_04125 [Mycolicibacterium obuense]
MPLMSQLQRRPVTYTPEEASSLAIAAAGLAGFPDSDSVRDLLARMDRGELNEDQAAAEVVARFTQPGFRDR